jgi:hypothetical protein
MFVAFMVGFDCFEGLVSLGGLSASTPRLPNLQKSALLFRLGLFKNVGDVKELALWLGN